jgi:hypothetical protein
LVRRWCRRELLPAQKCAGVWRIRASRPVFRTGRSILRWLENDGDD